MDLEALQSALEVGFMLLVLCLSGGSGVSGDFVRLSQLFFQGFCGGPSLLQLLLELSLVFLADLA